MKVGFGSLDPNFRNMVQELLGGIDNVFKSVLSKELKEVRSKIRTGEYSRLPGFMPDKISRNQCTFGNVMDTMLGEIFTCLSEEAVDASVGGTEFCDF